MKQLPKVSIISVNYNGKRFLQEHFQSLKNLNYPKENLEIIMVDNSSKDGSINFVRKKFPDINIIMNKENNYCKANNLGIKKSNGEFIALINNDTKVDKDWLISLVNEMQKDSKIGAAGSKIMLNLKEINSIGHKEHSSYYFKDEGFKEKDIGQYNQIKEIESICGCSVLYRRECLNQVGLLDEDFIMYCEDVDMSLRCKNKGWKLVYVPKSIIYHHYNGSGSLELQERWVERNRLMLIAKHNPKMLPELLLGSDYFIKNDNEFFEILPLVIKKLINEHGVQTYLDLQNKLFKKIQNYFYQRKDYLIKSFEIERVQFKEAKSRLRHNFEKLKKVLKEKEKELKLQNQNYEKERKTIKEMISKKEEEIKKLISDSQEQLIEKDKIIKEKEKEIKKLISDSQEQLIEKDKIIKEKEKEKKKEIEIHLQKKEYLEKKRKEEKERFIQELKEKDKEKERLIRRLEEKYEEILNQKDNYYQNELKKIKEKYRLKKEELKRIYDSKTHQLITSNLWAIAGIFKKNEKHKKTD